MLSPLTHHNGVARHGPLALALAAALTACAMVVGVGASEAKPAPPGPGNSPNAKQCQKGGWKSLYTSTGQKFSSESACTSYAAGGGTILQSPPTRTLTVSKAGSGTGTVTSAPVGINCGTDCTEGYAQGTAVTLTAAPAASSTFAGWSGACSGTGNCTVSMSSDKTAVASFDTTPPPPLITPDIYLGFADTFHTGAGGPLFTPSPWAGDPNVVFVGCTTDCGGDGKYAAGAIRIDNDATNTAPLTLVDAYVDIGDCQFRPWVALLPPTAQPPTALPGQTLVLTQTGQLGPPQPAPCDTYLPPVYRAHINFDTSLPPGEIQCDPARGLVPVITLVFENGTTLTVTDADKVLNTGGINRAACSNTTHSTPWTPVDPANVVSTP